MSSPAKPKPDTQASRLPWLDLVRLLAMAEIIGFHWLRTSQANPAFGLTASPAYENVRRGLAQLSFLITDRSGFSPSATVNNAIGLLFGYGWEAVNLFVLMSGMGLALGCQPERPGFTWLAWYARRSGKILLPYYALCFPMIFAGAALQHFGEGRTGLAGVLAAKLTEKNLPDPLWIEFAKHLSLLDPRQPFGIIDFFSPAWWFLPPILFAYALFPLFLWAARRGRARLMLPAAVALSAAGYSLTNAGILPEHGWYYVVLHEAANFSMGILLGRMLLDPTQAVRLTRFIASAWALPVGAALFIAGNIANWYAAAEPFSTWLFAPGLGLLTAHLSMWLCRFRPALVATQSIDSYHVYLLHQFLAFPLVVIVARLSYPHVRSLGFSIGFLLYAGAIFAAGLGFERIWRWALPILSRQVVQGRWLLAEGRTPLKTSSHG